MMKLIILLIIILILMTGVLVYAFGEIQDYKRVANQWYYLAEENGDLFDSCIEKVESCNSDLEECVKEELFKCQK